MRPLVACLSHGGEPRGEAPLAADEHVVDDVQPSDCSVELSTGGRRAVGAGAAGGGETDRERPDWLYSSSYTIRRPVAHANRQETPKWMRAPCPWNQSNHHRLPPGKGVERDDGLPAAATALVRGRGGTDGRWRQVRDSPPSHRLRVRRVARPAARRRRQLHQGQGGRAVPGGAQTRRLRLASRDLAGGARRASSSACPTSSCTSSGTACASGGRR